MTYPILPVFKGPGQRDLELAFIARKLGATARFTVLASDQQVEIMLAILNFEFVNCQDPNYKIGGVPVDLSQGQRALLPPFNFLYLNYNGMERSGTIEFSNAG